MRVMIKGVAYETSTSEFDVFATIQKDVLSSFVWGYNGIFEFSDGTSGKFYVFRNKKGIAMLRVYGKFVGLSTELETYLLERRYDVTRYMHSILK